MSDDPHHMAAAYALDALNDDERAQFEDHYPSCDSCIAEVAEFRDVGAALAGAEATTPPAELRGRVLDEINRTPQLSPIVDEVKASAHRGASATDELASRRGQSRSTRLALATAAAFVLIAGVVTVSSLRGGTTTDDVVSAPDAVVATLSPADVEGMVQIVWSADRDEVAIIADGLNPPGNGNEYALWFVIDDEVSPAALFVPDDSGDVSTVLEVDDLDADGWGITIEPAGGSPQPTTPILFIGSV